MQLQTTQKNPSLADGHIDHRIRKRVLIQHGQDTAAQLL